MERVDLPCGITKEMVAAWKEKFGANKIALISVQKDENTTLHAFVRHPDIKILSAAGSVVDKDPIKSGIILFENCWLAGDDEIRNDDELKMGVITEINALFKIRKATTENL